MGLALGAVGGYGLGAAAVELRKRELLAPQFDPWMAIPAVLLVYGAAEIAGAYGFLAAFAGGVGFRHYEHGHEYNRRVHDGAETVEKFGELAVILLIGSMVGIAGLQAPGLERLASGPGAAGGDPAARGGRLARRIRPPRRRARVHRLVRCTRCRVALLRP